MLTSIFRRAASSNAFKLTQAAAKQVSNLLKQDGAHKMLRIGLKEGGCAGFQYQFTFENDVHKGDHVFTQDDAKVVLNDHALIFLRGATLDFTADKFSSSFRIDIPKASGLHSCNCGKSVGEAFGGQCSSAHSEEE